MNSVELFRICAAMPVVMADHISLKIGSYNCMGYNATKRELLSKVDVLCIQEHWLSDEQLNLIGIINDKFTSTGVSRFDNTVDLTQVVLLCDDRILVLGLK